MQKIGLSLVLATIALSLPALSSNGDRQDHQNATQTAGLDQRATNHSAASSRGHEHNAEHTNHDHVALADMHRHLLRHLGNAHLESHTLGKADHWSRDWELRWIDYHAPDGHVRVYHATHKRNARQRYTMFADPRHPRDRTWHPVH